MMVNGVSKVNSMMGTDKVVKGLIFGIGALGSVANAVGFSENGTVVGGTQNAVNNLKKVKGNEKSINDKSAETYLKLQDHVDSIISESNTVKDIVDKLTKFTDKYFYVDGENIGSKLLTNSKSSSPDDQNVVEKNTKKVVLDSKKDDFRDNITGLYETNDKIIKTVRKVKRYNDMALHQIPIKKVREFVRLMEYTVEKAAYKFANDKVFKADVDPDATDKLEALKEAIDNYVTETFDQMLRKVGSNANTINEYADVISSFRKSARLRINSAMRGVHFVKKATEEVMNIANYASNISAIDQTKKQSESLRAGDKDKLDKAVGRGRLDADQLKKAQIASDKNQGMADLAASISKTMQAFGIGENAIKLATRVITYAADGTGIANIAISKAVNSGIAFARFAIRVLTDKNALKDYYIQTNAGKREIARIKKGYEATGKTKLLNKFQKESDPKTASTDLVSMISEAKGYEETSELVENTGMTMAQSIIFSASEYNPMGESKVMAITVMSVMGLGHLIGNTSMEAVEQLFNAFKMKQ
jgi:hypothetical protein